ncbi:DUF4411 family protein [Brucella anthropi]|uniref:DUF4411 family protein n=1 Tax=Brucella/Ochrobactrum group TaxID=2826938 RepID=UPI001E446CEC|nr:DUF4411 family protein [Brucella anthropi]MCQ9144554.1 DUF4411 family protein [Ochrobactrum sp. BTU2]UGQ21418.1 DUF4411 family protein [Brucella anthropi]
MHLIDANVLITAHNLYYPLDRFPEFWSWLIHMGEAGLVKMPLEILEEIADGSPLDMWLCEDDNFECLRLDEDVDPSLVQSVINKYATDLNDAETIEIGRDPFLIAYALAQPLHRCVVTVEASKPSTKRANRRIPDVCNDLSVKWCNSFQMLSALNFTTNWQSSI